MRCTHVHRPLTLQCVCLAQTGHVTSGGYESIEKRWTNALSTGDLCDEGAGDSTETVGARVRDFAAS